MAKCFETSFARLFVRRLRVLKPIIGACFPPATVVKSGERYGLKGKGECCEISHSDTVCGCWRLAGGACYSGVVRESVGAVIEGWRHHHGSGRCRGRVLVAGGKGARSRAGDRSAGLLSRRSHFEAHRRLGYQNRTVAPGGLRLER